jgi:hypothetical protein
MFEINIHLSDSEAIELFMEFKKYLTMNNYFIL